jgi:hypothetical protein
MSAPKPRKLNKALLKKYQFLKTLQSLPESKQLDLLPFLGFDGCNAIYDCVYNILNNKELPNRQKLKQKLAAHKATLRYLSDSSKSSKKKKEKLTRTGGAILTPILAAAVPLLLSYLMRK